MGVYYINKTLSPVCKDDFTDLKPFPSFWRLVKRELDGESSSDILGNEQIIGDGIPASAHPRMHVTHSPSN